MSWVSRQIKRIRQRVANRKEEQAVRSAIVPKIYKQLESFPPQLRQPEIDVVAYTRDYGITGYIFVRYPTNTRANSRMLECVASRVQVELPYGYRLRVLHGGKRVYPPKRSGSPLLTY